MDWFLFLVVADIFLTIVAAYYIGKDAGLREAVEKHGKKKRKES